MAGYTRQSTASIINGSNITAPPLNTEFNQLQAAFNATSGHTHTGGTGDAPKINLATSVSGYLPAVHGGVGGKNKLDATTTPVVSNDNSEGYAPGSMWENTNTGRIYICVGSSTGAAVWRELLQVQNGNSILPATTDTVDIGSNTVRFQDLFLSGGIAASGNTTVGGTLNITGATALGSTLGVTGDTTLANLSATGTTVITSVDLNSGAVDNTTIGSATPAAGTFTTLNANTSLVAATADINGGSLDGATVGASVPSTGSFTTLGASGTSTLATVDINGGNIDGTIIGASTTAAGSFTTLSTSGQATLASADINGGSIDGTTVGVSSASTGAFTTLTASGGITGSLTGNVSGNVTGNVTGAVTGNVTGNLTGNVTSSGSSSFNNVTIDGTLNMNAGTTATITNLTTPQNSGDAASKGYVDSEISALIGDAGAGLDTLGELADALNDDDDFSTTVTNSIATKLPKAGGTMTGAIAMSTNKITGAGDPTSAQDVSTKAYTDAQRDTRVAKTGDTMSGALAMGNNKITGLATPTANTDVTNKIYVDGILGSATVAATSATNAATSETNAATSATSSANSAAAALVSKNAAATSLSTFQNQYLGAQSSAPTQDPDGSALDVGDLYFDTVANAMKVYSSSGWTNAGSSVNGTSNRVTYTATAGQTVFAATYDSGYIDTFLNGVKLLSGTDFTATNGTSITLASGASVNDVVDIVAYGTFALADHYTRTASDARYVEVAGDTMTGDLSFGDNDKAIFGAGSDLEISSNGASAIIRAGNASSDIRLESDNRIVICDRAFNETFAVFNDDDDVKLYHDNAPKLATTSTGIDVTGTVTADGLTVNGSEGDITFGTGSSITIDTGANGANPRLYLDHNNLTGGSYYIEADRGNQAMEFATSSKVRMGISSNGDISFNEATGTTPKFFWDASAGSLGLGTSSPSGGLHVYNSTGGEQYISSNNSALRFVSTGGVNYIQSGTATSSSSAADLIFTNVGGSGETMRITSSGSVGIGTSSPTNVKTQINGSLSSTAGTGHLAFGETSTPFWNWRLNTSSADLILDRSYAGWQSTPVIAFNRSSGNVGIGTSSPQNTLNLSSTSPQIRLDDTNATGYSKVSGSSANIYLQADEGNTVANTKIDLRVDGGVVAIFDSDGLKFNGDTAAANALDSYEEGLWTPAAKGASSSNTATVTSATKGSYVKIGNQVTVNFILVISSIGSSVGSLQITGLPFTVAAPLTTTGIQGNGTAGYWQGFTTAINNLVFTAEGNTNLMYAYCTTSGTQQSISGLQINTVMGTGALRGTLTYRTT